MVSSQEAKENTFINSIALGLSVGFVVTAILCGMYGEWEYRPIDDVNFGVLRQTHHEYWMYAPLGAGIVLGLLCGLCQNLNAPPSVKRRLFS
jgi:hypothetical protein